MIFVVITYDINTEDSAGRRRLSRVAKACLRYGQRVQASVFECYLDRVQFEALKETLKSLINETTDSVRFYRLGRHFRQRIDHYGTKEKPLPDDVLIL